MPILIHCLSLLGRPVRRGSSSPPARASPLPLGVARARRGFTLVELMIVVAIIGVLAAVAIPSFMKYLRRSRTSEAAMNLRKLYDGTVIYYSAEHADSYGNLLAKQFPSTHTWDPVQGACCAVTGQKCSPVTYSSDWTAATWQALSFGLDDPFLYSYQAKQAIGNGATVSDRYDLQASGDLNCNGIYSLFSRTATISSTYAIAGGSGLYVQNELE